MLYFLLPLLLVAAASAEPAAVEVKPLNGAAISGELVGWDRDGVVVKTAAGEQKLTADKLLRMNWKPAEAPAAAEAIHVELIDGTRIVATEFKAEKHVAEAATPYAEQPLKISTDRIRTVELQPSSPAIATAWRDLEAKSPAGDVLLVVKKKGESVDYLAGVLGDLSADQADFEWDGERVKIKREKIAAVRYYHERAAELPDAVCKLEMADGSSIVVRAAELKGDALEVTTPAGARLRAPLASLAAADFSTGKLAYLSDLKPIVAKWTPRIMTPLSPELVEAYGKPRNDQSFAGSALSLLWKDDSLPARRDIRVYAKGLAIRSRTELKYRLPDGMQRFVAIAGIDPLVVGEGNVAVEIRGDGRLLWQGTVDGKHPPVELNLELKGARRLQVTVDYGENLDYGDRLHLVEARVTK